ncbi:MAG: hypothetical protein HY868_13115 [Chloroflexi bacterium]|nr:hypothetical protein [Chloroflexota bacterium]
MKKKVRTQKAKTNLERTIDKRAWSVLSNFDDSDDKRYWHSQTPQARLRYMEELRRMNYGNLATKRLSRVLEVAEREKS